MQKPSPPFSGKGPSDIRGPFLLLSNFVQILQNPVVYVQNLSYNRTVQM